MEKFYHITKKKDDSNFFSMDKFSESIIKKKSNDQRLFSPFKNNLDLFYLSLLIGLKYNIKSDVEKYVLGELTDTWTKELYEYSNARDYIIAVYLTEITKNIQNNKSEIKLKLNKALDNKKGSLLSAGGLKEIHEYCFGGYEKIVKVFNNQKPSSIVDFFFKYKKLLDKED